MLPKLFLLPPTPYFEWEEQREESYILKDSPSSSLLLPFGNKMLTSEETALWVSPAAVPWGVFFEFLFKAVGGSFRNNSVQGIFPKCKHVTVLRRKQAPLRKGKSFLCPLLLSFTVINHTQMKIKSLAEMLPSFFFFK